MNIADKLSHNLQVSPAVVGQIITLLDEGATIPFIARYRKEVTGNLDDQVLRSFAEQLENLRALEARRADVLRLLGEQGITDDAVLKAVTRAESLTRIEDLYRPFRPKRKTRASVAKALGLGDLAEMIWQQKALFSEINRAAAAKIAVTPELESTQAAIDGALDIIAEQLADDPAIRASLRALIWREGLIVAKAKKKEDSVYRQYYAYTEPLKRIADHRVLAIDRGEREAFLAVSLEVIPEAALELIEQRTIRPQSSCRELILKALSDAWKRLIEPSLSNEIRSELTSRAQEKAITVFAENLRSLLMVPPVRGRTILGLDPGYRNGCKMAVVNPTGLMLQTGVIYPTTSAFKLTEASEALDRLYTRYTFDLIVIGNGTASRETEQFARGWIADSGKKVQCLVVSEAGASIYSASPLAAAEFPELDVNVRSAVSIARRVQDPLAELVKIDPQSIGVGQYQHDMNQKRLAGSLGGVVESCVNEVGVDLNTASPSLLGYVAGITPALAKSIVEYRESKGAFTSRKQLLQVPRLGPKAFEQAAGFLRIPGAADPLDNTSVHPESYAKVQKLAKLLKSSINPDLADKARQQDVAALAGQLEIGEFTLADILETLARPGRDPRDDLAQPILDQAILDIKDLQPGMVVQGVVRNVADFGAFVDLGLHQDGLVHVSELADHFVRDPQTVVKIGQAVNVRVISVDIERKRIALSMKGL
ncbi:MAG: Tex family protein [Eubacteriales bacterium]|nr:Tex family protein [Eubacteriales bacterium]